MTYIPRTGAEALMPEDYQREIIENVPQASAVMRMARRAPDMSRAQRRIPCLSALPTAYFTNPGPNNYDEAHTSKRTTRLMWQNKYIDAEELNVIVPIPENVIDDADYDLWAMIKPNLIEAFGLAFDQAVFYGTNAPQVWPSAIITAAQAAGNFVALGSGADLYAEIMGQDGVNAKVQEDGFFISGHLGAMTLRSRLRALRTTTCDPIFKPLTKEGIQGSSNYMLDGSVIDFPSNGSIIPALSMMISGDWKQLMYAIRKDVTWKILDQSVIQDPVTGDILYNLAQQNMVALRGCMRLGWQVPNPINRLNDDETTRYPFAVLGQEGS